MPDDTDWIARARGLSPAEATQQGLSGVLLAFFGGIAFLIGAFFDGLSMVLEVLGDFRDFIGAFFTSPIVILQDTAAFTAAALTTGEWAFFGPFTWAVGVLSIVAGFWIWTLLDPDIPFVDDLIPWR